MTFRRARMYARDERTTRLERAVDLVEDGYTGLLVRRGEQDRVHPLDRPVKIPPDRATLKLGVRNAEIERGPTTIYVGLVGEGSNFSRPGIDTTSYAGTGGTVEFTTVAGGYGELGYGESGYSGALADPDGEAF